ncbi:MAG: HAD family hydrolase [Melioribacteraceae bacterium]|nr:HAD family hydrolase [Melioribacteraceae bacterium]MCF8263949.1 HAD family hydrolase [Melioribacteraceae bacterium]MCF8411801.1 HAD family hydrolase [Melioribacteraceae bacterium]MCF8431319.1 HAD family hydrolase [Melioribacteraceae bacterium]
MDTLKLKNLKLIVFDLDGTLLNSEGRVGEESKRLIKELRKHNVKFSIATGRLHSAVVDIASELEITTPLISLDGSIIKSFPEDNIIFDSYIPEKYVKKAVRLADEHLLRIALCHADSIYYTEHNSTIKELLEKFGAQYTEVSEYKNLMDKVLEIVIVGDMKDSIKFVDSRLTFPFGFGLNTNLYKSQSHPGIYYLEIRKHGCTKGTGLKKLAKGLGVRIADSAVLGDWYNDRELFETNALKVAVANAVPEIKYLADHVTEKTNEEDGVAEFLEMVLKAKT